MPYEFKMIHRVEWPDTDAGGVIHFFRYFTYMEVTEHAFFRSLGFPAAKRYSEVKRGWPRVHAECDFKYPLRFEDEVEVHLLVRQKGEKSLTYDFIFRKVSGTPPIEVARGSVTAVCVTTDEKTGQMKAAPIPDAIARKLEVAPPELLSDR